MFPVVTRAETRNLKRKFVISTEGSQTEPIYFERIKKLLYRTVTIFLLTDKTKSSPTAVHNRLLSHRYSQSLKKGDELWCVIDRDQWKAEALRPILEWTGDKNGVYHGVAISNPMFELWLAAHFIELNQKTGMTKCQQALECYASYSKKKFDPAKFTIENIRVAISRAKSLTPNSFPLQQLLSKSPNTNVYILLENLLKDFEE